MVVNGHHQEALVGIGRTDGRVEVMNGITGRRVASHRAQDGSKISRMLFAPDGRTLWCVSGVDNVFAMEANSNAFTLRMADCPLAVRQCECISCGKVMNLNAVLLFGRQTAHTLASELL